MHFDAAVHRIILDIWGGWAIAMAGCAGYYAWAWHCACVRQAYLEGQLAECILQQGWLREAITGEWEVKGDG